MGFRMKINRKRLGTIVALVLAGIWLWFNVRIPLYSARFALQRPSPSLSIPVQGVNRNELQDSWGAPRSGGIRSHQGIDIFAPKNRPILSTTPGIVIRKGHNSLGGFVITVLGPGLERHYYAHMNAFGTFRRGSIVKVGDIIGYVGNSGNAMGTPTHLHYCIYSGLGQPKNPYPRLAAGRPLGLNLTRTRTSWIRRQFFKIH